jgi:hypothetical protein
LELHATYIDHHETLLATEVVETLSTPPSSTIATPAKLVTGRRRQSKQRESGKHVTIRSIYWKLVDSVFEPLHARLDFTLEGCAGDHGLNSRIDLPHCSTSDSIIDIDMSNERVFINSPKKDLAEKIGHHYESCRRIAPTSTMVVFVLPSGLSSTTSLDTRKSTKNSQQGHNFLLASR